MAILSRDTELELAKQFARREGVIEGLEQALSLFPPANSTTQWNPQDAIRAEIDGMKRES